MDFEYLHPFRRYSRSKSEVIRNRVKFSTFLVPKISLGAGPQIFVLGL